MNNYSFMSQSEYSFLKLEGVNRIFEKYTKDENKEIIKFYFDVIKHKFFFTKMKYEYLRDILENQFLLESQRDDFFNVFSALQKCFFAFSRFVYLIKYKMSKTYNTVDLIGDPIQTKSRNAILIFQNNMKYHFTFRELINTINTSLSNSSYFFSEPVSCKNPYTNSPFNKSTLYNIYFAIKSSNYLMPILFHQYFLTDFDLYQFSLKNEELVREQYINSYLLNITSTEEETIREKVLFMFDEHNIAKIRIHRDFPEKRLLEIMRPYLNMYYKSKYYLQMSLRKYYNTVLKFKLHEFIKFNPIFGRRYISYKKDDNNRILGKEIKFNDKHPVFSVKKNFFLTSHLKIDTSTINEYRIDEPVNPFIRNYVFTPSNQTIHSNLNNNVVRPSEQDDDDDDEDEDEDEIEIRNENNIQIDNEDDSSNENDSEDEDEQTLLPNEDDDEDSCSEMEISEDEM